MPKLIVGVVSLYSQSGDKDKALADYHKVLELKPGDTDAQNRIKSVEARNKPGASGASPAAAGAPSPGS